MITTIVGVVDDKELNAGHQKSKICKFGKVILIKKLKPVIGLIMTFRLENKRPLQMSYNYPLVIQLKMSTTMVLWLWMDIESSVDVISMTYLKKLGYEKDKVTLGTLIIRFDAQATHTVRTKKLIG